VVQTICHPKEINRVKRYLREDYKYDGCIVEFGPMLGGMTKIMLDQLDQSARIFSYDLFTCPFEGEKLSGLKAGDSTMDLFYKNINNDPRVSAYKWDLSQAIPNHFGKVEFVFLDAAKSHYIFLNILLSLADKILPGAYLFDQDFRHALSQFWTQKVFYYLYREYLYPITTDYNSVGFRVVKPWTKADVWEFNKRTWSCDPRLIINTYIYFREQLYASV
jgi:hypothetical protein